MRKRILRYVFAACCLLAGSAHCQAGVVSFGAFSGEFVAVGDPGNTADTTGYGAVADEFQIMKFEWTNFQYVQFLNAVDPNGTNPNSIYNSNMGSDPRGGISFISGNTAGSKYTSRTNMRDKPVNFVNWFDAARVANWLHNGATSLSSTETGAYTLGGATSGNVVSLSSEAKFFIPTEDQWYKAAYYKGSGINAGYWAYATKSNTAPSSVTANSTGVGSAGNSGNFANYKNDADWNGLEEGHVTTVGTNGEPNTYGAFDMTGNIWEWNDLTGVASSSRSFRGGGWSTTPTNLSSSTRIPYNPSYQGNDVGFRIATLSPSDPPAVPEPSMMVIGTLFGLGGLMAKRRMKK